MPTLVHPLPDDASGLDGAGGLGSGLFPHAPLLASDLIIGSDGVDETLIAPEAKHAAKHIMFDSTYTLGTYANVTVGASFLVGLPVWPLHPRVLATSVCHTLGRCDSATQRVGSSCKGGGGYCYTSAAHTLECGHVISTTSYHDGAAAIDASAHRRSCPPGTPNTDGGATGRLITATRMPIAGCMLTSDASYEPSADVHVPAMCAVPTPYKPGCLVAGAVNYDPNARQSAECRYETIGCMDAASLGYNPLATVHDAAACHEGRPGCTLAAGAANYNASANVLHGCIPLVDGCMDSAAANYDVRATVQMESVCLPRVVGCMNPRALTFLPSATVNDHTLCMYGRALPPSASPPPSTDAPTETVHIVRSSVKLLGETAALQSDLDPMVLAFNDEAGSDYAPSDATVTATADGGATDDTPAPNRRLRARRLAPTEHTLTMEKVVGSAAEAASLAASINAADVTVEGFQAALSARGVSSATVLSAPTTSAITEQRAVRSPPPAPPAGGNGGSDGMPLGAIIGLAAFGGIFVCASAFLVVRHRRGMSKLRIVAA